MKVNFLSIGSNCAALGYLGPNRIRGPFDNVICKNGLLSSKILFNETLFRREFMSPPFVKSREKYFEMDTGYSFSYENIKFIHNDPTTIKFRTEFEKRYQNFKIFYDNLKTLPNYFFTYSLGAADIRNNFVTDTFYKGIQFLKKENIVNKIIIVGTKMNKVCDMGNYFNPKIVSFCNEYKIKYVTIDNCDLLNCKDSVAQFYQKTS